MFSPILVATALATLQVDDPVARLNRFLSGATHYVTTYYVSDPKNNKVADCSWELARPMTQRLVAKSGKYEFEFVQTPQETVFFAHHDKNYTEWPAFSELLPPPPEAKLMQIVYPTMLLSPKSLTHFKWSTPKAMEIDGHKVEQVEAVEKGQGELTLRLAVDDVGRPYQMYIKSVGPMGTTEFTFHFQTHERLSTPENKISGRLPDGYVPYQVIPLHTTVTAPSRVPAVSVFDAQGTKESKLDLGGKTSVVIFTSPDCDVSRSMQKAVAKAYAAYGKSAKFIEVSLGPEKPGLPGRDANIPLFWDKNGSLERSWGINYTPYVLVIQADGVVNRGFGGFGPDQEQAFLKTMAAGVKSDGD